MVKLVFTLLEHLKSLDESLKKLVKLEEQGKKWNYITVALAIIAIIVKLLR
jgi:hypothetical protein